MNAINHPKAQAIHATASAAPAVLLQAADPSKNLILVPLSRLVSRPTDDHTAQEAAFYDAPTWQRSPHNLRDRLTKREVDAHRHPLVRFVGLDTYEAAGGGTRRDLFAEADSGVYLTDATLLERLAQDKLASLAAEVKAEGWAWVDATPSTTYADLQAFQRARGSAATRTNAKPNASRSCKPRCRYWPRPWMLRWTPTTKKKPTPYKRKANTWVNSCRRWKMACRTTGKPSRLPPVPSSPSTATARL